VNRSKPSITTNVRSAAGNPVDLRVVAAVLMLALLSLAVFATYNAALKEVNLSVDGKPRRVCTFSGDVHGLLKEQGIIPGAKVKVYPAPQTRLDDGMTVKIVQQKGSYGFFCGNWQAAHRDDHPVEKHPPAGTAMKWTGDRAVMVGANRIVSRSGREIRFSRVYDMVATAYTYTGYNTATGVPPRVGTVAVDPSVIPLGSRLFVEGYGLCKAMDTGGYIKGHKIDVFLETKNQALSWGKQKVKVYLLE